MRVFIEGHKPRVVIGYGKEFWEDYRDLFEGREFKQEGQFQTAVFGDSPAAFRCHLPLPRCTRS